MRDLFGVPRDALLVAVAVCAVLVALILAAAAVRNPVLFRLAVRNAPRRPGFAALITLGLALGTVILSSAFTTGDTMSLAVRTVVAGALGSADEVVFVPSAAQPSGFDLTQAIASGNVLTGATSYFPAADFARVQAVVADDPHVTAIVPAILEPVAVEAAGGSRFRAQMNLIGVPADAANALATLRSPSGSLLPLSELQPDEVYLNTEAADALGAAAGDTVRLASLADPVELRVRDVTRIGDLGGGQAAIFSSLARVQQLVQRPDQLDEILVANSGTPADRLAESWPTVVRLRAALTDPAAVARAYRAFTSPPAREAIATAAGRATGRQVEKLRSLGAQLDAGAPTPEFIALMQDPELLGRVGFGGPGSGARLQGGPIRGAMPGPGSFRVLDVQQLAQDQADLWGSAFTDLFVVVGSFSLASGVLLIVLVFSLLALERRGELGITRALGGNRRDVVMLLAMEGAIYSIVSAAFGLVAGVALAFAIVGLASSLVAQYGFRLEPSVQPASLALSFGLGVALTFATVTLTAWRSSRFSIVTAIRDLPDPPGGRPRLVALALDLLPLLAGVLLVRLGLDRVWSLAYAAGITAVIIGLALVARWLLLVAGLRGPERVVFTLAGGALVVWWGVPVEWLRQAGLPVLPRTPDMSFLGGLGLLLGVVWLMAYNVGLLRVRRGGGLLWRLSVAYTAAHRFRTGLTLGMFGLVVLSLTLAAVLLTVTTQAYGDPAAATGGWDIRADSAQPPRDVAAELQAGGLSPDAFSALGAAGAVPVEAVQLGPEALSASWAAATLQVVDERYAHGATTRLTGASADDRATWDTLAARPGTAIVGAALLSGTGSPPGLRVAAQEGRGFRPVVLWLRDTRSTRPPVRLEVVGIADSRGPFGSAIVTGAGSVAVWPPPQRTSYFFSVPAGSSARELAAGISLAVPDLHASPIGEELRLVQGIRGLLELVLQGFMGVGMLAGVAALGTISMRAVVERRRQIGVLRALGLASRGIGLGLMVEAGTVATLGTVAGVAVGLAVARGTVELLVGRNPELRFAVPWEQLLLIGLAAVGASLVMTAFPAAQAARLSPADALRDG